jgi:hypothetical protein
MASAATTPSRGPRGRRPDSHGYGLVSFVVILPLCAGCFSRIHGSAAISHSHVFAANAHHVFANLRAWGSIRMIPGVLQSLAVAGVVERR